MASRGASHAKPQMRKCSLYRILWAIAVAICVLNQYTFLFFYETSPSNSMEGNEKHFYKNMHISSSDAGPSEILHAFQYDNYGEDPPLITNIICVALFLHVQLYHPELLQNTICNKADAYIGEGKLEVQYFPEQDNIPQAVKSHVGESKLPPFKNSTIVFTTTRNKDAVVQKRAQLKAKGYTVGIIQDKESMANMSIRDIVKQYATFFHLTPDLSNLMVDYFRVWDQLHECCGLQMSKYFRNEIISGVNKRKDWKPHEYCGSSDLDELESEFMNIKLYAMLGKYEQMHRMRRPSPVDGDLNGNYCFTYKENVRTKGITMNQEVFGLNNWYPGMQHHLDDEQNEPLKSIEHLINKPESEKSPQQVRHENNYKAKILPSQPEQQFSPWVQDYISFHQSSVKDGRLKEDARYIIYECKDGKVRCGGNGDRLIGMIKMFYLALCTKRVLLIDAPFPIPLTKVLNPSHIEWNSSFPETNVYLPDMIHNETSPIGLRESVQGYRILQTNAVPRKRALDEIWKSTLLTEHLTTHQWGELASETTLASAANEAFRAMFKFDPSVIARANEFKASAGITGPYAGLHMRKGDAKMGVTGQSEMELKGLRHRETDNNTTLSCYEQVKASHSNAFDVAYLASDDVHTKQEMARSDSSIRFAQNMKPFHVDLFARKEQNHQIIDTIDHSVLSGTIDAWAEMLILSESACLLISQSMFSFGSLYMRYPGRCAVRLKSCDIPAHREGHYSYYGEQVYERGWVVIEKEQSVD